jgi:phage tail sheath protein FI
MPKTLVPGIYLEEQKYVLNNLHIEGKCLTGFVGIAERGPLHTPVLISSFDEYLNAFGSFDTAGNLPFAVYNYFKCGGSECIIIRIANEKYACHASLKIKGSGRGYALLEAKTPGIWGNYISARIWHEAEEIKRILEIDTEKGSWISLDYENLSVSDILRISISGRQMYRTINKKEGNRCYLDIPLKILLKVEDPAHGIKIEKTFVSLSLSCKGDQENFLHLSMNPKSSRYYLNYINSRSRLCTIQAYKLQGILMPFFVLHASGGKEGTAEMTEGDFIGYYNGPNQYRGLGALESRDDISLISVPDSLWLLSQPGKTAEEHEKALHAVQLAMVNQAERFSGRFAVLDMPSTYEGLKAVNWARHFDSHSAAAYFPFIDILDPLDKTGTKTVRVPPSGAVCGCISAVDSGKGIFYAPANIMLQGAVGLSTHIGDSEYEMLYPLGINLLRYFPGKGIKIWGARTLSSDPEWRYINVRRTFSAICRSLKNGTQWAIFEPNTKDLRKRLVRQVSGFLLDLWMEGYLAGSTAEQGFYVRCDEELNPPENIDNGIVTIEVGIAITKPTEFFTVSITAEKEGASVYIQEN